MLNQDDDIKYLTLGQLPAEIQPHLTQALRGAREQIAETGAADSAILIYGDETLLIDANFQNEREKDMLALMVREMVQLQNAHLVVHISEVWAVPDSMPKAEKAALLAAYGAISRIPQRIEQVMVHIECRDGGRWLARADIQRKGRAVTLGAPAILDMTGVGAAGRFAGWFAPEKDTPDWQAAAEKPAS